MKKVLITGGAGFIGTHLSQRLLEQGYGVIVLDNLSPQILDRLKAQGYVDANGKLTAKFYTDTNTLDPNGEVLGSEALNLDDASLDCCFKDDIYQLLISAAQGKISENIFTVFKIFRDIGDLIFIFNFIKILFYNVNFFFEF